MKNGSYLLPTWLAENADELRIRAARARRATANPASYWGKQVTAIAEAHEEAARVYEQRLRAIENSAHPSIHNGHA